MDGTYPVKPGVSCKDEIATTSTPTPTSTTSASVTVNVNLKVLKIDLTTAATYGTDVSALKTEFPTGTKYVPSKPTTTNLSYQRMLNLLHSSSTPDEFTATAHSGTVKTAKILTYTDEWYTSSTTDAAITATEPLCGTTLPVQNAVIVTYDANNTVVPVQVNWNWGNVLFKSHPSVASYNSSYADEKGYDYIVSTFLLNARGVLVVKDPSTGSCSQSDIDQTILSAFAKNVDFSSVLEGTGNSTIDANWLAFGQAMDIDGAHNAIIAMYMNNIANPAMLDKNCADENDLFADVQSHEMGHHLLSAGHDPTTTMWMNSVATCQNTQTLPYLDNQMPAQKVVGASEVQLDATGVEAIWVP
jgi:hypothetical protein